MKRREFVGLFSAGLSTASAQRSTQYAPQDTIGHDRVTVERALPGKPHAGKVLLAVQPHADDIPIFAAGTVAKLMNEGYTGYLLRVTNDDMAGPGSIGDTVLANEKDNNALVRVMGFKGSFDFNYNNHWMDGISKPELRLRLIYLIRLLKVNTVISYDPWGHYEENPDHYVTAQCVEAACWMAGGGKDYPEHFAAGLKPHSVTDKYYYARGPQLMNRVVDISTTIDKKVEANLVNVAQGPAGSNGARLRAELAKRNVKLPVLGDSDDTANRNYIKEFVLKSDRELGKKYGCEFAEPFRYVSPNDLNIGYTRQEMDEYIKRNAVPR